MSPSDADIATDRAAGWSRSSELRTAGLEWARRQAHTSWPQALVFAASAAILTHRMLAWRPSIAQDTWVATISGQAIVAGRRPPVSLTNTTPKPLATLLAAIVSPLPPTRAMAAVTIAFTALLVTSTFIYGLRHAGPLGAVVAVGALMYLPALPIAFHMEQTDVLSAALLVTAIVSGPRGRIAWLVLMGLLRPQVWVLAGVAGYLADRGRIPRRVVVGVCCALLPMVLWLLLDAIINGSPLASYHANSRINAHVGAHSIHATLRYFEHAIRFDSGSWIPIAGLAGFAVGAVRARRIDPFIAAVLICLPAGIVVTWLHMPFNVRYTFPVAALFPLGCAHLAGLVPRPRAGVLVAVGAAAVALAIVAATAARMPQSPYITLEAKRTAKAQSAAPAVGRALACGPVAVDLFPFSFITALKLSAVTRHALSDFRFGPDVKGTRAIDGAAAVVERPHAFHGVVAVLRRRGWRPTVLRLGVLWRSPRCT